MIRISILLINEMMLTVPHPLFRYEASSLEDVDGAHREQDFGYEVIDQNTAADVSMDEDEEVKERFPPLIAPMIHLMTLPTGSLHSPPLRPHPRRVHA